MRVFKEFHQFYMQARYIRLPCRRSKIIIKVCIPIEIHLTRPALGIRFKLCEVLRSAITQEV